MRTQQRPRFAAVVFDADSTLASIEGVDWLGARRGDNLGRIVENLTTRAMAGELPLDHVYTLRLNAIRPTRAEIALLSDAYIAAIEPGARELITQLQRAHVKLVIVSGGLRAALLPLAQKLGLAESDVHAVELMFDDNGNYVSLANGPLLAQQLGKPVVVRGLCLPHPSVMIGDGSTDAAVRGDTDEFIAYTRVVRRERVVAAADAEARNFDELSALLFESVPT